MERSGESLRTNENAESYQPSEEIVQYCYLFYIVGELQVYHCKEFSDDGVAGVAGGYGPHAYTAAKFVGLGQVVLAPEEREELEGRARSRSLTAELV